MDKVMAAVKAELRLAELRGIVKFLHRSKTTTSYVPPAMVLGVFSGGSEYAGLLGEIQVEDHKKGDPFLCSLVIGAKTGVPGPGYFAHARKLGYKIGKTPEEEFLFWAAQMGMLKVPLPEVSVDRLKALGLNGPNLNLPLPAKMLDSTEQEA